MQNKTQCGPECGCSCSKGAACACEGAKTVKDIAEKHSGDASAVITCLQQVQDEFGYISEDDMKQLSEILKVPQSEVYGVVSFYSQFRTVPPAEYTIDVCMGTACYVLGAPDVLNEFETRLNLKMGDTSSDGKWKIASTRCLGCCGLAPVVTVNGKVYGHVKRKDVAGIIQEHEAEGR